MSVAFLSLSVQQHASYVSDHKAAIRPKDAYAPMHLNGRHDLARKFYPAFLRLCRYLIARKIDDHVRHGVENWLMFVKAGHAVDLF